MNQHLDLDALQAAAEAATPGPWNVNYTKLNGKVIHWHVADRKHGTMNAVAMADEDQGELREHSELRANGEFIAAANPAVVLALIDRLRKAEAAREGWKLVPIEPTREIISAMSCSQARDDEGEFPAMLDLLDFGGENKTHAALKAAYRAAIAAAPDSAPTDSAERLAESAESESGNE